VESLGAVESLAECPSLMTHASVPDDQLVLLGIDDNLIRLFIGIESCRDLIADLDYALNGMPRSRAIEGSHRLLLQAFTNGGKGGRNDPDR